MLPTAIPLFDVNILLKNQVLQGCFELTRMVSSLTSTVPAMKKTVVLVLALVPMFVFAQQTVTLKSGEKMSGKVQSYKDGVLELLYRGSVMKINESEIYSINFVEQASMASGESTSSAPREVGERQVMAGNYLVRYKVADRTVATPPKVDNLTQKKGTVVVDITIDKYGHVRKAVPGAAGTTTSDSYLRTKAQQAAESTLFNNAPTAPTEQSGYMIIAF